MVFYKERILNAIKDSKVGLTTVDVAKKASVSKTTVIKYLSVLSSEGEVEFVEVGPSKLWRLKSREEAAHNDAIVQHIGKLEVESLPIVDIDLCNGDNKTIYFTFRVRPEQICSLMKLANKCICKYMTETQ